MRKLTTAPRIAPKRNSALLSVTIHRLSVSGAPPIAAMSGVMRLSTMDVMIPVNAAPMTTATARSMTLPRRMKSLNPVMSFTSSPSRAETCRAEP